MSENEILARGIVAGMAISWRIIIRNTIQYFLPKVQKDGIFQ